MDQPVRHLMYLSGKAKQTVSLVSFVRGVPQPTFQLLSVTQHGASDPL